VLNKIRQLSFQPKSISPTSRDLPIPRGNTDGDKTLSPLRYPGAKRQLVSLIKSLLYDFSWPTETFVEPFAGGASVGIQLAADGVIHKLILNDSDELISSFWATAAFDSDWLIEAMWSLDISLAQWERMKTWDPLSTRDRALKCLYLNRTSFSGILNSKAGPIGGKQQKSKYLIDCRFSRPTIQHRIKRIAALARRGCIKDVWNHDWKYCIELTRHYAKTIFYLDPPFYAKAKDLYRHSFTSEQHIHLSEYLKELGASWILSYDDHPAIRSLYQVDNLPGQVLQQFTTSYRAATKSRQASELIVTNFCHRISPNAKAA
jgi:DNA adenine methylase